MITCRVLFYVLGALDAKTSGCELIPAKSLQQLNQAQKNALLLADGLIFEIVKPQEYAGKIVTMHRCGPPVPSIDRDFVPGKDYAYRVKMNMIGGFDFMGCSEMVMPDFKK